MTSQFVTLLCLTVALLYPTSGVLAEPQGERRLQLESIVVHPAGGPEERVVHSLLLFRAGDRLRSGDLVLARHQLEQSGFFQDVDVYTARGTRLGQIVLHVEASLDRSAQFESGFGFQPYLGWYLNLLGVRWNSPWQGGGHIRLAFRIGQRMREVYVDGMRPQLGGTPFDLLIDAGGGSEDWLITDADRLLQQQIDRARLHFGLRRRFGNGVHTTVWAGVSSADPQEQLKGLEGADDDIAGTLIPVPTGQETYGDLIADLVIDHRDPVQPWRRGTWMGLRLEGSTIRGGKSFWRAAADMHTSLPLPADGAFALLARGNYAGPATPYHRRWVVGGTGSIRGFRDASLSGPRGARAFWQGTAELRMPLVKRRNPTPAVTGILFLDVGDHWDADGARFGMSTGAGYGLRVRIPWIHIFALDVGIPLTNETTGDPFWVHGSLGFMF